MSNLSHFAFRYEAGRHSLYGNPERLGILPNKKQDPKCEFIVVQCGKLKMRWDAKVLIVIR